ncbi:MAG TPA: hypothetical protein VNO55_14095 [Polyangia bacterium]|nr:hypothetical protein [Polyangia bacterium]
MMRSTRPAPIPRRQRLFTPIFDPSRYPAPLLSRVAGRWQQLYVDEQDAVISASLVTTDLARLGAPAAILALAARVIEDNVRHVEVCARVLDSLGVAPRTPAPETTRSTLGRGEAIDARCARALITGFTVAEPLAAAGFAAARSLAREPLVAWGFSELLRDEARHGAFGAKAGGWVIRDWTSADRQALWPDCVAKMEAVERRLGGPLPRAANGNARGVRPADRDAEALGMIAPEVSCDAVVSAIPRWVLPHLHALGILPQPIARPAFVH